MLLAHKSWDLIIMGGLKQTSFANIIFLFIIEAKTRWKAILTHCLKNWMQKDKDKWPFNYLSWKRQTHSLMKRSISSPGALCTSMAIGIKWCPSWGPLYLTITFASWLMTFEAIISYVKSITTTLATKTWSFQVM